MVHGHAADQEVVLDEPRIVVGEVHHQVNVTIADKPVTAAKEDQLKSARRNNMHVNFLTVKNMNRYQ